MRNRKTPKPGSEDYDVENTQNLNIPEYNSSTGLRRSSELPSVENLDDQYMERTAGSNDEELPEPDLGNKREGDEGERERLINR